MSDPRECPMCGVTTRRSWCCGIDLTARKPWTMTRDRIRAVHVFARSRKGLDEEAYRLRLAAVGVSTSLAMTRDQFTRFMRDLRTLPDAPAKARAA